MLPDEARPAGHALSLGYVEVHTDDVGGKPSIEAEVDSRGGVLDGRERFERGAAVACLRGEVCVVEVVVRQARLGRHLRRAIDVAAAEAGEDRGPWLHHPEVVILVGTVGPRRRHGRAEGLVADPEPDPTGFDPSDLGGGDIARNGERQLVLPRTW